MTRVSFVFRFDISEVVYPTVDKFINSKEKFNLITGDRVRREFLTRDTEVSRKIKAFIDEGKLIPKQYWWPFWTGLMNRDAHNVYTAFVGDLEQLIEFEKHLNDEKVTINNIIHLRVNDIDQLVKLAKQKYRKIYDQSDLLIQKITKYDTTKDELIAYAKSKYNVVVDDFFTKRVEV